VGRGGASFFNLGGQNEKKKVFGGPKLIFFKKKNLGVIFLNFFFLGKPLSTSAPACGLKLFLNNRGSILCEKLIEMKGKL
jgi:hypothetical protein